MDFEKLVLPWPPKELQPNARIYRLTKAKFVRVYRETCWALAMSAPHPVVTETMHLKVTFSPPTLQARDLDNCLAAIKAGLDGVADAWKVNDRAFRPITIDIDNKKNNCVVLELMKS